MKKIYSIIVVAGLIICYPLINPLKKAQKDCPQQYQKLLVLAVSDSQNKILAENMETYLAAQLKEQGYSAVSAIKQYGFDAFKNIREEEPLKQFYPYDAVVMITLLNREKEKCCQSISDSSIFLWEYYSDIYNRINAPGYYTAKGKYYWKTNLYALCNWQQKYSAHTQSFDSDLKQVMIPESGKQIISDLIRNQALRDKPLKAF